MRYQGDKQVASFDEGSTMYLCATIKKEPLGLLWWNERYLVVKCQPGQSEVMYYDSLPKTNQLICQFLQSQKPKDTCPTIDSFREVNTSQLCIKQKVSKWQTKQLWLVEFDSSGMRSKFFDQLSKIIQRKRTLEQQNLRPSNRNNTAKNTENISKKKSSEQKTEDNGVRTNDRQKDERSKRQAPENNPCIDRKNEKRELSQDPKPQPASDYDQKVCKVCYDARSEMLNVECGHLMMCKHCYEKWQQKYEHGHRLPCPVCKTRGRYIAPRFA